MISTFRLGGLTVVESLAEVGSLAERFESSLINWLALQLSMV